MKEEVVTLAKRFFDSMESGNAEAAAACLAADCRVWHNVDEVEQTREQCYAVIRGLISGLAEIRYAQRRVSTFPGGFVQQHQLEVVLLNGEHFAMPAAVVGEVGDEGITRLDEYLDTPRIAKLRSLMAQTGPDNRILPG